MQVYQTDHEGFYVGTNNADPDPLQAGNWLIPGGCVTAEPPELAESQLAKWTGSAWTVVDPVPEPEPEPEPEPTTEQLATQARAQRNSLLAQSDWTQVADAPVDKAAWAGYRQALRDLPANTTDPRNPDWPVPPV